MNALIDTSVWSLALRRKVRDLSAVDRAFVEELVDLVNEDRARIIGAVRQELLSGIKVAEQYRRLRLQLRAFLDEPISTSDYESAAKVCNDCRSKGIAATPIDSLICAVALDRQWSIFTIDADFERYAQLLPIRLHAHRG